ncbi:MAG: hypothetical protein OEU36_05975, partial [Gammaproteobacteria bacterium]|nr:hypothetical protein [Gammaproteobacteria bacterium]
MSEPVQQAVDLEQLLGYSLATDSPDALARTQAVSGAPLQPTNPTSLLSYRSQGSLLIIGSGEHALQQARQLKDKLRCTVLMTGLGNAPEVRQTPCPSDKFEVVYGRILKLAGHLGQFKVDVELDGKTVNLAQTLDKNREHFDLVLDLGASPQLTHQTLPFGYYATGDQASELHRALAEIPELVGEFEKPKYFSYNADICAHSASGVSGCTRCLDACPTDAIRSVGEKIEVDPYLCQGGGSCAT